MSRYTKEMKRSNAPVRCARAQSADILTRERMSTPAWKHDAVTVYSTMMAESEAQFYARNHPRDSAEDLEIARKERPFKLSQDERKGFQLL